eukprot:TRINITY_DN30784_c0_g1_i1.p1 TRINITY_DN30784_c0_g1~~TRINITY_DN30784_c0_g1_i1.p1  ORF type:complete len:498 (-),score=47.32 TRINITY_DN30784_c0_g1_i1:45-1538(-)
MAGCAPQWYILRARFSLLTVLCCLVATLHFHRLDVKPAAILHSQSSCFLIDRDDFVALEPQVDSPKHDQPLSSSITAPDDLCDERWGGRVFEHLQASQLTFRQEGITRYYFKTARSGAPWATGELSLLRFVRGELEGERESERAIEVSLVENYKKEVLSDFDLRSRVETLENKIVAAQWGGCPKGGLRGKEESGMRNKSLFVLDGNNDLESCNVWHRMAAIYSVWLSREFLSLSPHEVDMLKLAGWPSDKCASHQTGLQLISRQEALIEYPRDLCEYSSIVVPMAGGWLWDLAWDKKLSCGPGTTVARFARDMESSLRIEHEPVRADSPMRICLASRAQANTRILTNEDQIREAVASCKYGDRPAEAEVLRFSNAVSFKEQVQTVDRCDILVGAHGAGLTHSLWLEPGGVVIEILPKGKDGATSAYAYFRNLAKLNGQSYFAITAEQQEANKDLLVADMQDVRAAIHSALFTVSERGARRMVGPPVCSWDGQAVAAR